MRLRVILVYLLLILPVYSKAQGGFPLPVLPNGLKGTEARANYLALHYWDNYDFSNILMLEKILLQPSLSEKHRQEFGFDLKMAKKNCLGSVATDFCFITRSGKRSSLLETHGEYILLFLGDPDCDACSRTKDELLALPNFMRYVDSGRLKVLYVCVEGETDAWKSSAVPENWIDACDDKNVIYKELLYDIPGLPVLYLLDASHRVLLKDVFAEHIERFFIGK